MRVRHRGIGPEAHATAFIAPTAVLVGRIVVEEHARILYGAVADSEGSSVSIGAGAIVCENAVLRATAEGDRDHPVRIGDHAFIGPHATVLGCHIEPAAYIATGATVLQGATVGSGAVVSVGALVHANAVVPKGAFVPPHSTAIGNPVRFYGTHEREALALAIRAVEFPSVAFGVTGTPDPAVQIRRISEVRGREFGRHFRDEVQEEQ